MKSISKPKHNPGKRMEENITRVSGGTSTGQKLTALTATIAGRGTHRVRSGFSAESIAKAGGARLNKSRCSGQE